MKWIPAAHSRWWLTATPVAALIVSAVLLFIQFGLFGQTFTVMYALRLLLIAVILSAVAGGTGWLGARFISLGTAVGMVIGFVWLAAASTDNTGWEDLIGFIGFLLAATLGFAAGIAAELTAAIIRWLKQRHRGL
ncbi:hypothetical protein [Paenibacillus kobensis]|uniref:hypothetical protein n=1 Tax=Paenibacillus kobensis TaxID=59841 RepID=UPI000FDAA91E|nr:hypothetical protein [Paenibacillus kobensis]